MSWLHFYVWNSSFWRLSPYGLLHSPVFKSSRWPQSVLGQPRTGWKTSFHYFRFISKYDRLRHAIIIRSSAIWIWLVISNPRSALPPMWQEMLLRTPDPLCSCEMVWARDYSYSWLVSCPDPTHVRARGSGYSLVYQRIVTRCRCGVVVAYQLQNVILSA